MEIWKPIPGHEGLYEVSSYGKCRSLDRVISDKNGLKKTLAGKTLSPKSQTSGHLSVHLSKKGKPKQFLLHRLVAFSFVEGYFDGAHVRHLDGDCKNNNITNLDWGSMSDNSRDMYHRHGLRVGLKSHFSKYQKRELDFVISLKGTMSSSEAGKITGISRRYISHLWKGDAGFQKAERHANAFTG